MIAINNLQHLDSLLGDYFCMKVTCRYQKGTVVQEMSKGKEVLLVLDEIIDKRSDFLTRKQLEDLDYSVWFNVEYKNHLDRIIRRTNPESYWNAIRYLMKAFK